MDSENKEYKINVTSTLAEKGLDMAKDFLNRIITPAIEEVGLLFKDHVASWRFNNQLKILNRAKEKCEKNNISPKTISLKLLCPYLEYASLEEDEFMQDKWANLLTNLVDSEQNIENNIFPHILSQISHSEFSLLQEKYSEIAELEKKYHVKFENYYYIKSLANDIQILRQRMVEQGLNSNDVNKKILNHPHFIEVEKHYGEFIPIKHLLENKSIINIENLKPFEIANLIRLGLIEKNITNNPEIVDSETAVNRFTGFDDDIIPLSDLKINMNSEITFSMTELGQLFMKTCMEKSKI